MIVIETQCGDDTLTVVKLPNIIGEQRYNLCMNGIVRHPNSTAEDAMRAMANYIYSLSHRLDKNNVPGCP